MPPTKSILRTISSLTLGFLATLVVFGLLLTLIGAVTPDTPAWELVGALVASGVGLCAGGFVVAFLSNAPDWVLPGTFGLFFGGISFIYIFGPAWIVLVLSIASALIAALGALIFRRLAPKRMA